MPDIAPDEAFEIPVDPNHGALRTSMVGLFVFLMITGYIVTNAIIPTTGINIIALFISLALTYVVLQLVEARLKKRWPSGRLIRIDADSIRLVSKSKVRIEIKGQLQTNVLLWRFETHRRSRVPKGWYVVACALEQDEIYLPVYTLMSPNQFQDVKAARLFSVLPSKKDLEASGLGRGRDLRLAGEQRRLHIAEQARWMSGVEMTVPDFETYIVRLQSLYPKWMPSN